jgi:hypothetical protein
MFLIIFMREILYVNAVE